MPRGTYIEFFSTSCSSPGTVSNRKVSEIRKSCFLKGKNTLLLAIFAFIGLSGFLYFVIHPRASKIATTKKIKRHLTLNEFDKYQEENIQNDVEIIPEDTREYQHPNHRYAEEKMLEEPAKGLFSKPPESKTDKYPRNIQDIILEGKTSDPSVKGQNKFWKGNLKGPRSSMWLKGVYKQPGLHGSQLDKNYHYSKEINNLMQNGNGSKGGKRLTKDALRDRGAPFQLPAKGWEILKRHKPSFRLNERRQPITIYLDFYPMEEFRRKKYNRTTSAALEGKFPDAAAESVNVKTFHPPRKHTGMIMKLNLYPKEFQKDSRKPSGGSRPKYNEKAERKSFGWFSKHKKKKNQSKKCSFAGLNPNEKHITAKWKNENGEWIHAKHVTVKYLNKESELNKR